MSNLIENGPYQLLNKELTDRLTRKLSEKLLPLERSGNLSENVYNKIRPRHKQPPGIYGLPKINKADVPLRPAVSCVNTFAYDLSAYLANILYPLTGNSDLSNLAHFASAISSEMILDHVVFRRRVPVYQHSYRRRCKSRATENDTKLAFLDTAVSREPDGRLTTSIYRKPTYTDQYLAVWFTPPIISKTRYC